MYTGYFYIPIYDLISRGRKTNNFDLPELNHNSVPYGEVHWLRNFFDITLNLPNRIRLIEGLAELVTSFAFHLKPQLFFVVLVSLLPSLVSFYLFFYFHFHSLSIGFDHLFAVSHKIFLSLQNVFDLLFSFVLANFNLQLFSFFIPYSE
jgi:hypothetical protein